MEEQLCTYQTHTKEKKRHLCSTCGSSFTKKSDLTRHERIHTGERPFTCNFCGANFSQASSLKTHIRKHTGERPYKCQHCGKTYAHSHRLKSHILKCHADSKERIACRECSSTPEFLCDLQRHAGMHSCTGKQDNDVSDERQKEVRCCDCTDVLGSVQKCICISEFKVDKGIKHVKLSESSSVSRIKFSKSILKSRTSQKNVMCDVCGSFYADTASLRSHLKAHDTSRSFKCNSCHQSFGHEHSLKRHKTTHSHERPFICHVCGSSFTLSGNLKIHMRIHSGEKPYTCEDCSTKFTHSQALKAHRKTHIIQGRDKHLCKLCISSFSSMKFLNQHLQTHLASSASFRRSNMSSPPVFVIQEASINEGLRLTTQTDLKQEKDSRSRPSPLGIEIMNDYQCRSILDGKSEKEEFTSPKRDDQKGHSRSPLTPPLNGIDSFPTFQDHYISETENIMPLSDKDAEETETVSEESSPFKSSQVVRIHDTGGDQNYVETSLISLSDQAQSEEEGIAFVNGYSQRSPSSVLSRSRHEKSGNEIHLYSKDNFYEGEHNVEISYKTIDLCLNQAPKYNIANSVLPMMVEKRDSYSQDAASSNVSFEVNENDTEINLTSLTLDMSPMNVNESITEDIQIDKKIFADNSVQVLPTIEGLDGDDSGLVNEYSLIDSFPTSSCQSQKINKSITINIPSTSSLWKSSNLLPLTEGGVPLAENQSLEISREMPLESTLDAITTGLQALTEIEEQRSTPHPILCSVQAEKHFDTFSSTSQGKQQPKDEKELFSQLAPLPSESFAPNTIQDSANATHNVGKYLISTIEEEDGRDNTVSKSLLSKQGKFDSESTLQRRDAISANVIGQDKKPHGGKDDFKTKDFENIQKSTNPQNPSHDGQEEQTTLKNEESELKCANCPLGLFDASVISVLCQDECFGVMVERNSHFDEKDFESGWDEGQDRRKGKQVLDHIKQPSLQEKDPLDHVNDLNVSNNKGSGFYGLIQSEEENGKIPGDNVVAINPQPTSNATQQSEIFLSENCKTAQAPSHIVREPIMPANAFGMNFQESSMTDMSASENQHWSTSVEGKDENALYLTLGTEKRGNRQYSNFEAEKHESQHQHPTKNQESLQYFDLQSEKQISPQCLNSEMESQESFQSSTGDNIEKELTEILTSSPEKHNHLDTTIPSRIQTNTKRCVKRKRNSFQRSSLKKRQSRKVTLRSSAPTFTECGCIGTGSYQIKRPRLSRHNGCRHACKCNARFNQSHHLHDSQQRSVKKPPVCQICHLSFIFHNTLKSNLKTYIGKTNISIKKLQISSASFDEQPECLLLGTHVSCIISNPNFSASTESQPERISQKDKKAFLCQICGESLSSLLLLNRHINGHNDKTYACNFCSARFNKRSNLVKHMRIHNGDRPYKCQICLKSFTQKTNLQVHMRIHTGEMPFTCQQCGSSFAHSQALRLHMRFHAKDKRFVCQTCGKGFVVKAALDKHILSHTREKPFVCNFCDTKLSSKSSLSRHVKRHKQGQGLLPFFCSVCSARFAQPGHLKLHLKSHPACRVTDNDNNFQASEVVDNA